MAIDYGLPSYPQYLRCGDWSQFFFLYQSMLKYLCKYIENSICLNQSKPILNCVIISGVHYTFTFGEQSLGEQMFLAGQSLTVYGQIHESCVYVWFCNVHIYILPIFDTSSSMSSLLLLLLNWAKLFTLEFKGMVFECDSSHFSPSCYPSNYKDRKNTLLLWFCSQSFKLFGADFQWHTVIHNITLVLREKYFVLNRKILSDHCSMK